MDGNSASLAPEDGGPGGSVRVYGDNPPGVYYGWRRLQGGGPGEREVPWAVPMQEDKLSSPPRTRVFGGIRTKLIGAFLIVVLVPLVGTGLYGNWVTSRTLTQQALQAFQHDLAQRAQGIQGYLTGVSNSTLYLSSLPSLRALVKAREAGDQEQIGLDVQRSGEDFLRFADTHPGLLQVRYIAEDGQEWIRVNSRAGEVFLVPPRELQNKAQRYYFQEAMKLRVGQIFVSDLDLNRELGQVEVPYQPVMRYATPVSFSDGRPAGVVVINVNAQDVLDLVLPEGEEREVLALVNREGYYLAHPDATRLWGGPKNLAHGYGLSSDYPGLEARLLSGNEGHFSLSGELGASRNLWGKAVAWAEGLVLGPERVVVYQTVRPVSGASEISWVLLRDEPRASVFASMWSFRVTAAGILAAAALLALLMAVALARGLTAPILALTRGVRRLAEGQLEGSIEVTSRDELGELARAFSEMAVALHRNLERLTLLNQGGQHIAGQMERPQVLDAIIRAGDALVTCECCVISLTEASAAEGVIASCAGDEAWLSHRGTPAVMTTLQEALDRNTWQAIPLPSEKGPEGYLCCAPLCTGPERQGLVEVYGRDEALVDPATGSLLAALANQGSIALEKADLIQQLRDHRAQLEALLEQLIGAQEEERRVVAYDIHDGLAQMLVGVRLNLSNYAAQRLEASPEAERALQRGLSQLAASIAEARRVIEGLRPIALDELGLVATLHQHAQELAEEAGWELEFHADPADLRAPPSVETTAFRIAQEALTNARKYAGTDRVRVSLTHQNEHLAIEVRDWGQGFDPTSVLIRHKGVGLAGIRERARLLGGECAIDSQPGRGTTVRVTLPLPGKGSGSG